MEKIRYTDEHLFVARNGEIVRIGLTPTAVAEIGEIQFVEWPVTGKYYEKEDVIGTIESSKSVFELYAPVSGTITCTNEDQWSNDKATDWLFEMMLTDTSEWETLLVEMPK
ncbi:MAG: glycine cleavage system protein H [Bacilli bacterium]